MVQTSNLEDKPATSPRSQVWAQVVQDLTDAANSLPVSYGATELGRATKGAAYALMAKALMQQGNYSAALVPLAWLVTGEGSTVYDLMPNYRDNFVISSENNKESVFEWQFQLNASENHDDDVDPRTDNLNYGTSISQFFGPSGVGWSDGEAQRWVIREFLQEKTAAALRDPRLEASFLFDSTDVKGPDFSMIYGQTFTQRYGKENKRVWFRKFRMTIGNFEGTTRRTLAIHPVFRRVTDVREALNAEGRPWKHIHLLTECVPRWDFFRSLM